ncbi:LCP family protein [Actinomycetospora corticicola]|uniref:LCP family protein required for cell wall assembly n=1 Tax=Actinomycetospora corticicola TaxID=663602 RepID=A0A7Y9E092_9PSEU|nr:LCP family protein required for cell wall assembly [Actinomycetospora corticicola]
MCSALVLLAGGTGYALDRSLTGTSLTSLTTGSHSADGSTNILLIGLDTRRDQDGGPLPTAVLDALHAGDGNEGGYNTNTLILLHVPDDGGKVTAFSIPRDDLVPIPGYRPDKIKQAYGVTKAAVEDRMTAQGVTDPATLEQAGRAAGRQATVGVVQTLTGLPVDHVAEVTLAGFYDLANALGGVTVCLNHAVQDSYSGADFPAGVQQITGSQALAFVRQRHGLTNGDLDRTHRQQAFLSSAMHQVTAAGTWTDPSKLAALLDVAHRDVVLDQGFDVLSFAASASNLTSGDAAFYTLPIEGYVQANDEDDNEVDPAHVQAFIRQQIAAAAAPPAPPAAPAPPVDPTAAAGTTVQVDNASGTPGEAASAETMLVGHGFSPGATGTVTDRAASTVVAAPGDAAAATLAASLLGGGVTTATDPGLTAGHLRIVLGTGYRPPAAPSTASAAGPSGGPVQAGGVPCVD